MPEKQREQSKDDVVFGPYPEYTQAPVWYQAQEVLKSGLFFHFDVLDGLIVWRCFLFLVRLIN